ncbi:MAG: GNAT family N-acetyltransferase [Clostridiaceae bacterium]|nr:GNAT family N-acetyltransferase [Eubacteriales bacterium]
MVTVKEVKTKAELRKFVDFPNKFYKDVPQFIPAMYGDDLSDWDPKQNPAFEYCEGKCFLAYRDGKLVGRIGAILSHKANATWNTKRMRFSQVDFIDDAEVVDALFKAVEDFAREKGCNEVHGPLGFCDLDREGMLVEGFDRKGMFITYYNHPYYNTHMERMGYHKDVDWVEFLISAELPEERVERFDAIALRVLTHNKLSIAPLRNRSDYGPYIKQVFELLNVAYAKLYGVVALTEKQIARYCKKFIPLVDPDYVCFVMDENNKLAAFGVSAPSLANAMKKSRGRLFPFGAFRVLRALKHNDTLDLFLIAVRPDLQGQGVNAILLNHIMKNSFKNGIRFAETGPQLEHNEKVQAQWKTFNKEQHKRRRCYIKQI